MNISGCDNVFLGHDAGYNETSSNKLYISNSDTASPLIGGDFAAGVVTINSILTLTPLSGSPTPTMGMIYSDALDSHLYYYNGSVWKQLD